MNGEQLDVLVEEGAESEDDSVRRREEVNATGIEVRGQGLALDFLKDVVAVALGDEFYVKGD
jgi:hypothetical protein